MSRFDRDTIRWRLHLRSDPVRVFELLATPAGRAAFWAESAEEHSDEIEFRFVNGIESRAKVLAREPGKRFELEYFGANVVFELAPDGAGGTDLTLTTTGFEPGDYEELLAGWLNVLFPLKAFADFGVDLRSHDPRRTWQKGYVDQ